MQEELDEAGLDSSSVLFTQHEVANLLDTSAFHSLVSHPQALLHEIHGILRWEKLNYHFLVVLELERQSRTIN